MGFKPNRVDPELAGKALVMLAFFVGVALVYLAGGVAAYLSK